ncbi:MAG: type II toxin-antitoxin system RelB/DinJ family antitoxin [Selenomonadaceae bacterium]|nr:type II toxin-antitoxin system RelB/DinJ family antitoxin [Selenomonadaceae bacterium]
MATFQMTLDDDFKANVDELFEDLGLDTETAVKMFFKASLARNGITFSVKHYKMPDDLQEAIRDARMKKNLYGPFDTVEEAMASMLRDD